MGQNRVHSLDRTHGRAVRGGKSPLATPSVEHGFYILPGEHQVVLRRFVSQFEVATPGVEVGGVWLRVFGLGRAV